MDLEGKVAIITGAASGIGRATAILFAKEGAKVVVVDINRQGGEETVDIIRNSDNEATFVEGDVSKATDAEMIVKKTVEKYAGINILFNNAGVVSFHPVTETSEEEWNKTIDVNLKGIYFCSKYVIREMKRAGGGSIVNTASIAGLRGLRNNAAYVASKGGVIALTQAMALDHASDHIRVNCICPGGIRTPMYDEWFREFYPDVDPEVLYSKKAKVHPLGRMGTPDDIAYAALFLASDESSFITGAALPVDGGRTADMPDIPASSSDGSTTSTRNAGSR